MSREIKFRAWDSTAKLLRMSPDLVIAEGAPLLHNDDDALMQYTGLKDREGKEIYEGDVVEFVWFHNGTRDEVRQKLIENRGGPIKDRWAIAVFRGFGFRFKTVFPELNDGEKWIRMSKSDSESVEIIGNIYENPELLDP